jgi:hypothetical protein
VITANPRPLFAISLRLGELIAASAAGSGLGNEGQWRLVRPASAQMACLLTALLLATACAAPRTAVRAELHDDRVVVQPSSGSEDMTLTLVNVGSMPCDLVVFIPEEVNGPVDVDALPVLDGRVDFESRQIASFEEGLGPGGPPVEPGEERTLTLGNNGAPTITRMILCNGVGDYERGRYGLYQSDGT